MLPANSLVVKCPHCGGEKELLQLMSGNTIGAKQWSDSKQIYPMMPRISPVQKCLECGRYYLWSRLSNEDVHVGDDYSFETGWLSFEQAMEASQDIDSPSNEELRVLAIITVWAYNDIVRNGEDPSELQRTMFVDYVSKVLSNHDVFAGDLILLSELYREIGNFDKCISILDTFVPGNDFEKSIISSIVEKAKGRDDKVFEISTVR